MRCVLSGPNVKIFSKAIQALAKTGSELFIEAMSNSFSMRTVNSTKSAFAVYEFLPTFFTSYILNTSTVFNKCKVSLKVCVGVFKNIKNVEHCKIFLDSTNDNLKLVIQLKCKLETLKTHSISIIDVEIVQASYKKENSPNKISGSHKLFTEICNNFQINEEEITFEANQNKLVIKNYIEGTNIDRRFMRSQLSLKADEFENYSIGEETSITFCLKEFRAFLNFAESLNLPITVLFETGGRPIVFVLESIQSFEANLVVSTLSQNDFSVYEQQSNTSSINATISNPNQVSTLSNTNTDICQKNSTRKRNDEEEIRSKFKKARIDNNTNTNSLDQNELFNFRTAVNNNTEPQSIEPARNDICNREELPLTPVNFSIKAKEQNIDSNQCTTSLNKDNNKDSEDRIFVTFKNTENTEKTVEDQDSIPASPPAAVKKKKKLVFKRCFEETMEQRSSSNQILANNSDTE